jgi:hypothetical protein
VRALLLVAPALLPVSFAVLTSFDGPQRVGSVACLCLWQGLKPALAKGKKEQTREVKAEAEEGSFAALKDDTRKEREDNSERRTATAEPLAFS